MEYKILRIRPSIDSDAFQSLGEKLNDGWGIERVDVADDRIIYIISRGKNETSDDH